MNNSIFTGLFVALLCSAAVCQSPAAPSPDATVTEARTATASSRTTAGNSSTVTTAAPVNTTTTSTPAPPVTTPTPPDTTTATTTTTTATPATPLDPSVGHWSASDEETGHICVLLQMGVQMKIPYQTTLNSTKTANINIPVNASATGSCGDHEYIQLSWPSEQADGRFTVTFEDNSTAGVYQISSISAELPLNDDLFPDHSADVDKFSVRVNFSEAIEVPQNASYRCISRQTFQLLSTGAEQQDFSGELLLLHSQLQAYRHTNSTKFAAPLVCAADHHATSDVVPIAVGIALALLVVIILVAYIIGRRRARQRGYQSV